MKPKTSAASPEEIFAQWDAGRAFKEGIGDLGMYEQNRRNERFFVGDQWHGAKCGGERPLVRHNVIKRIGEYKMAVIGSNPVAVNYHAEGVANTLSSRERVRAVRETIAADPSEASSHILGLKKDEAVNLLMSAMSDYFNTTAERLRFDALKEEVLREAYIRGTAYLHIYWDPAVQTGLYADERQTMPIRGDVQAEVLDVDHVYFGDPQVADIESQPYILIAQRKTPEQLEAMRTRYKGKGDPIRPDGGDTYEPQATHNRKATLLTKLWKEIDEQTGQTRIMAVQVCRQGVVRPAWSLGIRRYPLVSFTWEARKGCAYGDSEVTYLIPNQIAINRMITASVWAVMMMGIPITVVNGDVVQDPVSNDPGQVLRVYGSAEDVQHCVQYVNPPQFSPKFDDNITSLIHNTLMQAGANDAALGDLRADNASAIIAVREAALLPLQTVQRRFYGFVEDFARLLAEFWVTHYGQRPLKIADEHGVWFLPFRAEEARRLFISATIDVGAGNVWGEAQTIQTLDNLLRAQVITPKQYLERLPQGVIPNLSGLIREGTGLQPMQEEPTVQSIGEALPEGYREQWESLSDEQRNALWTHALRPVKPMG